MDQIRLSRRELPGGLAVATLAARLPCAGTADKPANAKRFDFHRHFFKPALIAKDAQKVPDAGADSDRGRTRRCT